MHKSIFVESIRLLIVLALMSAGYGLGTRYGSAFLGSVFGASLGYVAGGVLGRFLRSTTEKLESRTDHLSAGELLAGALGGVLGGLLASLVSAPAIPLLPGAWGWLVVCIALWVGVDGGFRISRSKSDGLLALARLSDDGRLRPGADTPQDAVLADTSVLVDPRLLPLTRAGFLHRNLLVPSFILDEIRAMADAQEPAGRRNARRGLEALEAIRRESLLHVHVLEDEVPEVEDVDAKLVALASRRSVPLLSNDDPLGRLAELRGIRCLSLNRLVKSLSTTLLPGELVKLSIVKPGQESGEGVGYLDEGSMVVVANAASRVGQEVGIRITSSARTAQGRIFFASLADA